MERWSVTLLSMFSIVMSGPALAQGSPLAEGLAGVATEVRSLRVPAGYSVRSVLTRPRGLAGSLPAVLFVQWLSCDPVTLPASGGDGWARMLRGLIERSGMVVARTEKPGLSGSGGPRCEQLGYQEELEVHRAALRALLSTPGVAPDSIFLFGGSMGGTMVALLAAEFPVRGVMVWGSTGVPWRDHLVSLDRRVMQLQGDSPEKIAQQMPHHERLHHDYLVLRRSPAALARLDTALARAWGRMIGTSPGDQYGRPFAFHQEAHAADWTEAWRAVRAPVLVVRGEHDWIMPEEEHRRIVELVASRGGRARFITLPHLDHNFERTTSMGASLRGQTEPASLEVAEIFVRWLAGARRSTGFEDALLAPPAADSTRIPSTFDPLLGSWSLEVTFSPGTDSARTHLGEWHFSRILSGRAIQDVWRVVASGDPTAPLRGYGTTIRLFDPVLKAWRSTWHGVLGGSVVRFIGTEVADEIHLVPEGVKGPDRFRWVFFAVSRDSFRWSAESTQDDDRRWVVQQEMRARRMPD